MRSLILLLLTALMSCDSARPTSWSATAITDVTVIDAINGVRHNQTVIFSGDEITAIAPTVKNPANHHIIDGTGKFLIPGLWDFHVHLTYEPELTALMPRLFLSYGITSVRDTGGLLRNIVPVVQKMQKPGAIAPRVFFAGPLLDGSDVVYDGESRPEIGVQNATKQQARTAIETLKAAGASFIKIYELVSEEVFFEMVSVARALDIPIDSHVPLSMLASIAGPQVDSIEHLRNIELDCATNADELHRQRLLALKNPQGLPGYEVRSALHKAQRLPAIAAYDKDRCTQVLAKLTKTLQVPTLRLNALQKYPPFSRDDWQQALSRIPDDMSQRWQAIADTLEKAEESDTRFAEWSLFLTGKMHQQGVPIGAGTDTPIRLSVPGYSLHSELEMLVLAGLTPLQAIAAATIEPARYFSIEHRMGQIAKGMKADLLLLEHDPLKNIKHTKAIALVVSKGTVMTPDEILSSADRQ